MVGDAGIARARSQTQQLETCAGDVRGTLRATRSHRLANDPEGSARERTKPNGEEHDPDYQLDEGEASSRAGDS